MNILLTGSGGFIGQNLKNYLEKDYKLLCPRSYQLDLTDKIQTKNYLSDRNIDLIIHCASVGGARGVSDKNTTIEDNLMMVENLLEYKGKNCKLILFGSGAMYGKTRNLHKVKEDEIGKFEPEDLYGKSKMMIAQKIKNREDVVCLNIFACYGYGEKESRFPSYAIECVLNNKPIIINQNVIFDYLFVEDMQRIVKHFIFNNPVSGNIINITPNESVSLYDIANIVNGFESNKVDIKIANQEMNFEYTGDNLRLRENIPDIKFTSIESGLKKLYNYKKEILVNK